MNILQETAPAPTSCGACKEDDLEAFDFSMAFQPIVDTAAHTVFAYEALARGVNGEPAFTVLERVNEQNRYAFDQLCRVKAITLAAKLGVAKQGTKLTVNFMPGAVYSPAACIRRTLKVAAETGFPLNNLIFELTEDERVRDTSHLQGIVTEYKKHGFALALDDFGAGYSGMNLLADLEVDILKLDMRLIRDVHKRNRAAVIVRSVSNLCHELRVRVIGECVETLEEYEFLRDCGITLMQGYLFAKPAFESLPTIAWPKH